MTNFLNWHNNAHTKHELFVKCLCIYTNYADNISISFSTLPAAENGPYRACTVIVTQAISISKVPETSLATNSGRASACLY